LYFINLQDLTSCGVERSITKSRRAHDDPEVKFDPFLCSVELELYIPGFIY